MSTCFLLSTFNPFLRISYYYSIRKYPKYYHKKRNLVPRKSHPCMQEILHSQQSIAFFALSIHVRSLKSVYFLIGQSQRESVQNWERVRSTRSLHSWTKLLARPNPAQHISWLLLSSVISRPFPFSCPLWFDLISIAFGSFSTLHASRLLLELPFPLIFY